MTSSEFDERAKDERLAGAIVMRAGNYAHYVVGYKSPDQKHCFFVRQPCKTDADLYKLTEGFPGYWDVVHNGQVWDYLASLSN